MRLTTCYEWTRRELGCDLPLRVSCFQDWCMNMALNHLRTVREITVAKECKMGTPARLNWGRSRLRASPQSDFQPAQNQWVATYFIKAQVNVGPDRDKAAIPRTICSYSHSAWFVFILWLPVLDRNLPGIVAGLRLTTAYGNDTLLGIGVFGAFPVQS